MRSPGPRVAGCGPASPAAALPSASSLLTQALGANPIPPCWQLNNGDVEESERD